MTFDAEVKSLMAELLASELQLWRESIFSEEVPGAWQGLRHASGMRMAWT